MAGAYGSCAPGEARQTHLLREKNIPPHCHGSCKLSIITQGRCTLFVHRQATESCGDHTLEIALQPFDIIALPAGTGHTYDAGPQGFAQIVITDHLLLPHHPEYARDVGTCLPDLDRLPRRRFSGTKPTTDMIL
jgi:hypothetical protein